MTAQNRKMEFNSIEEEIKEDKSRDFRTKLKIVRNIIEKLEDESIAQNDSKRSMPTEKRVQILCQVDSYFIYQATKLGDVQKRKLSLKSWLQEQSLQEKYPYGTHAKARLREPFIHAYLIQRTIPLEDIFKEYLRHLNLFRWINYTINYILTNCYTLCRLPKTKQRIIIEKSQRHNERLLYLQKITQCRDEGRKIIYLEERIVIKKQMMNDNYEFRNECTHCIVLLNEEGIMVNFKIVCRYSNGGAAKFLLDFIKSNLDRLPPNCVVVIGDKGYHTHNAHLLPTKFSSKKQMTDWLEYNEIKYNADWHRAELCKLIEVHKRDCKVEYYIENLFKSQGHDVARCPFHCQFLSHFNDFWEAVHGFANENNMRRDLPCVITQSIKKAGEIFTPDVWKEKEKVMIKEEQRILKEDLQVEEIVDRLCTMTKYGDADENKANIIDLDHPLMEVDYNLSRQVASILDETERYLIKPL